MGWSSTVNGLLRAPSVLKIIVVQGAAAAEQEKEEGQEKVIDEEEKENNEEEDVNEEMRISRMQKIQDK